MVHSLCDLLMVTQQICNKARKCFQDCNEDMSKLSQQRNICTKNRAQPNVILMWVGDCILLHLSFMGKTKKKQEHYFKVRFSFWILRRLMLIFSHSWQWFSPVIVLEWILLWKLESFSFMPIISRDYIICICFLFQIAACLSLCASRVTVCLPMTDVKKRWFFNVLLKFFEWRIMSEDSAIRI